MLITYPSPLLNPETGVSFTGTHVTSLSGMVDGRSGGLTVVAWGGSEGSPSGSETIRASLDDGKTVNPRVAALVNLEGLPAGLSVDVSLKRPGGAYDYQTKTVETHTTPSGEVAVLAFWDSGLDAVDGVQFKISNTDSAVAYDDEFAIGEVWLADAQELALHPDWVTGLRDQAGANMSKNGQLYLQPVPAARSFGLSLAPTLFERAVLDEGAVLDLQLALANDPRCVVIADHQSQARAEKTWLYGSAVRLDELRFNRSSRRATAKFQFDEMIGRSV